MRLPPKKNLIASVILLLYSILVVCFITFPLFNASPIEVKKQEIMIITLLPLAAFILAFVILFNTKAKEGLSKLLTGNTENILGIVFTGLVLFIANLGIFTKTLHDIKMCDSIWTPAWIISLTGSIVVSVWVFKITKRSFIFVSRAVLVSILMFGLTYGFLICLFQVLAFAVGCVE